MAAAEEAMRIDIRIHGIFVYCAFLARNSKGPALAVPHVEMETRRELARQLSLPPLGQTETAMRRPMLEHKPLVVVPTVRFPMSLAETHDGLLDSIKVISVFVDSARPQPYVSYRWLG